MTVERAPAGADSARGASTHHGFPVSANQLARVSRPPCYEVSQPMVALFRTVLFRLMCTRSRRGQARGTSTHHGFPLTANQLARVSRAPCYKVCQPKHFTARDIYRQRHLPPKTFTARDIYRRINSPETLTRQRHLPPKTFTARDIIRSGLTRWLAVPGRQRSRTGLAPDMLASAVA